MFATVSSALLDQGFRQPESLDELAWSFEYGSAVGDVLLGGVGLAPVLGGRWGRAAKHGYVVAAITPQTDASLAVTVSLVSGVWMGEPVETAIAAALASFADAGVLLDAGSSMSAPELPRSSPAHPLTFRSLRAKRRKAARVHS